MSENQKIYRRAIKQSKAWQYLAWSLPMIWLAVEFLTLFFGFEETAHKFLLGGGILFFIISILWWWWAVDTIRLFAEAMQRTSTNFDDIKKELRAVRKDIKK